MEYTPTDQVLTLFVVFGSPIFIGCVIWIIKNIIDDKNGKKI